MSSGARRIFIREFWRAGLLAALATVTMTQALRADIILTEGFNNLSQSGWVNVNNSAAGGNSGWFQGNGLIFPAQSGPADSYAAVNFLSAGAGGDASAWLISPVLNMTNGDRITFYTRTTLNPAIGPDRLEVRLNPLADFNAGSSPGSVGNFNLLLTAINPSLSVTGYPAAWTQYTATIMGLSSPGRVTVGFRYFITDTNVNGDYIGLDNIVVNATVPEPGTVLLTALGACAIGLLRLRNRRLVPVIFLTSLAVLTPMLHAADARPGKKPTSPKRARRAAVAAGTPAQGAAQGKVKVYFDPVTGEQGPAPAGQSSVQTAGEPRQPASVVHEADGSLSAVLGPEQMVYSVAKIGPDGSVIVTHATAAEVKALSSGKGQK